MSQFLPQFEVESWVDKIIGMNKETIFRVNEFKLDSSQTSAK